MKVKLTDRIPSPFSPRIFYKADNVIAEDLRAAAKILLKRGYTKAEVIGLLERKDILNP